MELTPVAVIWDVDGTLVDTAELHFQAWLRLAAEIGKPFTRADFAATFGWRNPEIVPKIFGTHYSEAEVLAIGDRKELFYRAEASKGVELLPGVRALVSQLAERGVRQAIGSSAPRCTSSMAMTAANVA
jgi:beta-phosphoglucomutase